MNEIERLTEARNEATLNRVRRRVYYAEALGAYVRDALMSEVPLSDEARRYREFVEERVAFIDARKAEVDANAALDKARRGEAGK